MHVSNLILQRDTHAASMQWGGTEGLVLFSEGRLGCGRTFWLRREGGILVRASFGGNSQQCRRQEAE